MSKLKRIESRTECPSLKCIRRINEIICSLFDPQATASCDGSVRIWSTEDGKCVKKLDDLFTSIDKIEAVQEVTRFHRLVFLDDSNLLVAAERSLKLFSADSFSLKRDFEIDEIIDDEECIFTISTGTFREFSALCR